MKINMLPGYDMSFFISLRTQPAKRPLSKILFRDQNICIQVAGFHFLTNSFNRINENECALASAASIWLGALGR